MEEPTSGGSESPVLKLPEMGPLWGVVKPLASRIIYSLRALRSSSPEGNDFRHFRKDYFDQESKKKKKKSRLDIGIHYYGEGSQDRGCPRVLSPKGVPTVIPALSSHLLSSCARPTGSPGDPHLLTVLPKNEHRSNKEQIEGGRRYSS